MCGILVAIRQATCSLDSVQSLDLNDSNFLDAVEMKVHETLLKGNKRRGPDATWSHTLQVFDKKVTMSGSVLHLRGKTIQKQPVVTFNVLLFNGEIYAGLDMDEQSDTLALMNALECCHSDQEILMCLSSLEAEFAWVYYQASSQSLYYARDCLGRRSLLRHVPINDQDTFYLSSVGCSHSIPFEEVPTLGIYCLDLKTMETRLIPWSPSSLFTLNTLLPILQDIEDPDTLPNPNAKILNDFQLILTESVRARVETIPVNGKTRLGILFSGGIDCMILASLASSILPPHEQIDLLNVAFENQRVLKHSKSSDLYNVPDRKTARLGLRELSLLSPRNWNLIEINVPMSEANEFKDHIVNLLYPSLTVMDLSIAMAFWFASRGVDSETKETSDARVLLSGLGADEQLGGYGRHRSTYNKGGWESLIQELQLDVSRISSRNLGRDDRIVADHGKEVRFPYLDTRLVAYLSGLQVQEKVDLRYSKGLGDKILIRQLARKLGLNRASIEPKRAVQFGARTAKMELGNQKGQDPLFI